MNLDTIRIGGSVKLYTYRTARLNDIFLSVPRSTVEGLEQALAKTAGAQRTDNHTVYEITQNDEKPPVCIWFTDFTAHFGHSVREGSW